MTIRELIADIGAFHQAISIVLAALVAGPLVLRALHGKGGGEKPPWNALYTIIIYAVSIPGMFSLSLCAYALFFTHENLLDQDVIVYIAPTAAMIVTLVLCAKTVDLNKVPGFGRITGLMATLGVTFLVIMLLSRLHFFVGFFSGFGTIALVGVFLFAVLRWGMGRVFRAPGEAEEAPPKWPLS